VVVRAAGQLEQLVERRHAARVVLERGREVTASGVDVVARQSGEAQLQRGPLCPAGVVASGPLQSLPHARLIAARLVHRGERQDRRHVGRVELQQLLEDFLGPLGVVELLRQQPRKLRCRATEPLDVPALALAIHPRFEQLREVDEALLRAQQSLEPALGLGVPRPFHQQRRQPVDRIDPIVELVLGEVGQLEQRLESIVAVDDLEPALERVANVIPLLGATQHLLEVRERLGVVRPIGDHVLVDDDRVVGPVEPLHVQVGERATQLATLVRRVRDHHAPRDRVRQLLEVLGGREQVHQAGPGLAICLVERENLLEVLARQRGIGHRTLGDRRRLAPQLCRAQRVALDLRRPAQGLVIAVGVPTGAGCHDEQIERRRVLGIFAEHDLEHLDGPPGIAEVVLQRACGSERQ